MKVLLMNTNPNDTIVPDSQAAAGYDEQAQLTHWVAPEVVFRLAGEYVRPGDELLDLGIGSGLSSLPFHGAGLQIYGLDGSQAILDICRAKGFAKELVLHDLRDLLLPYENQRFDAIIAVGVFNSFQDLEPLFGELGRLIRHEGIVAFTVEDREPGQDQSYAINRTQVNDLPDPETALRLYRHSQSEIADLLAQNALCLLHCEELVGFRYPAENRHVLFRAYVARRAG